MIISVFDRVENIVGKGENAGYQHFLLFPQCFQKASYPDRSKGVIVWERVNDRQVGYQCMNSQVSLILLQHNPVCLQPWRKKTF